MRLQAVPHRVPLLAVDKVGLGLLDVKVHGVRGAVGHVKVLPWVLVEFENSYEPNGPFGAKSIGEVVINTPLPAVADAIYHATHKRFYELPITREQIAMAVEK